MITARQRALFWRVFERAWGARAARPGTERTAAAREEWRHGIIREASGQPSLGGLDNEGFDRVMERLHQELGEEAGAARFAEGEERRLRWRLDEALSELDRLEPERPHGPAYVRGILRQARMRSLDDLPARDIRKVLAMVRARTRKLESLMEAAPF